MGASITVDSYDDRFTGALNKQYTAEAAGRDFALVGGFSLEDSFGGIRVGRQSGRPQRDQPAWTMPRHFCPTPSAPRCRMAGGEPADWSTSCRSTRPPPMRSGTSSPSSPLPSPVGRSRRVAMEHVGLHVVYVQQYAITQTDFNANVIAMRNAGVKMLFIDQMPANYAASVFRALDQQDFHPIVILGTSTYSEALVAGFRGSGCRRRVVSHLELGTLPGRGRHRGAGGVHLSDMGAQGSAGVHARSVHALRMDLGGTVRPGAGVGRSAPHPRVPAPGTARSHLVQCGRDDRDLASIVEVRKQLLLARTGREREVPAARRPSDLRKDTGLPLRGWGVLAEVVSGSPPVDAAHVPR